MDEGEGGLTAVHEVSNQSVTVGLTVLNSPSPPGVALSGSKELRETFARFFNSNNDRMATPNQSTNVHAA